VATWKFKSCPRCGGDLFVYGDMDGWYEECLQCAYERQLKSPEPTKALDARKEREHAKLNR
jgi:hypothetical protein